MLYPFIYLRVYYRGFQDSLFPRWPDFLASRGYGGSMATHGPSVLAGPRSKFCGLHSPPHPLGHGLAGVSRQRLYHGWWMLVVQCCVFWEVSNLSNDPMLCFFPDSYLEWGWGWRWWYDWWWLMDLNSAGTQAASFSGRRPGRVMILYQGAFWESLWSSEGNQTCSCCLGDFLKSMLDPTDSIWFFTDEMLWSNSWWSWVPKTVGG